ncbi:MAG TPA: DUF4908 domain-containing protein [Rhizomicrobium sp.]|jgi:hypothetical protein|nr:DUF4908 domain-containing protein [Rhizomicrobium sp.]
MPKHGILFACVAMLASVGVVRAQEGLGARMSIERLGDIQTGAYTASNGIGFTLAGYAEKYLLRFAGEPETYVLYVDHGSLGGRVLKFDSGGTALAVSGWGAVTIYTDAAPGGLPADRTGNSDVPLLPPPLSLSAMQRAAEDAGEHLAYTRGLHIVFNADWAALAGDAAVRALTFDALQNTARGIDRFTANAAARLALLGKMDSVRMISGGRPSIALHGRTLSVTFSPTQGFAGRASSHGIARALGQLFAIPTAG